MRAAARSASFYLSEVLNTNEFIVLFVYGFFHEMKTAAALIKGHSVLSTAVYSGDIPASFRSVSFKASYSISM